MTSLRKFILFFLLTLTVVFNMERVDLGEANIVDIQSFVYIEIFLAVALMILLPLFQQLSIFITMSFWTVLYVILKLTLFTSRPLLGGVYMYLSITELAVLNITILVTHSLCVHLNELESVVENISFPSQIRRIPTVGEAADTIKAEFIRSRRYERPLSVLVIELNRGVVRPNIERIVREIQQRMVERYLTASLARLVTKEARRTDIVLEHERNDRLVLVCPEMHAENSTIVANRIQSAAQKELGLDISVGVASFPGDALTFEDLLQKAEGELIEPSNHHLLEQPDHLSGKFSPTVQEFDEAGAILLTKIPEKEHQSQGAERAS